MQWTLINGRLQPDPLETNRTIAQAYDEITRLRKARFELQDQLSRSRKLLNEAHGLLAKIGR
jgi:hypothetical protein